jgi:hypothetical protein
MDFSNQYAPEHLILATESWQQITAGIINAGSVFLGNLTPESAGDYASGTNHTLPTSSYARAYSGVSVDSFVKKITFQHLTRRGGTKYRSGGRNIGRNGRPACTQECSECKDANNNKINNRHCEERSNPGNLAPIASPPTYGDCHANARNDMVNRITMYDINNILRENIKNLTPTLLHVMSTRVRQAYF